MPFKPFILYIALVFLSICTDIRAQKTGPDTQKLVYQYLDLSEALVKSDLKKSKIQANKLAGLLSATQSTDLQTKGAALVLANSLPEMRSAFAKLSTSLKMYLSALPALEDPIYVAHCPMALNDTGAIWLTDEKKVVNPYFGMEMLHCGKILGTVNATKP